MFRIAKSRLILENLTRWSSAFLLLESVKKAYENNLFDGMDAEQIRLVPLETIDIYLQILKPAYLFSIQFQRLKLKHIRNHSKCAKINSNIQNDELAW